MDIRNTNRPQPPAASQRASATSQPNSTHTTNNKRPRTSLWFIIVGLLVIVATITGIFWWKMSTNDVEKVVQKDGYQAVFLSNNQVYFGRLENISSDQLILKDVFYLQVQQPVQPQKNDTTAQTPQQASLSKLGSEVHGPEDAMYINREHVLFWENLKSDSKVVQAIKETKKN